MSKIVSLKCPQCNAPCERPEASKDLRCSFCGAPLHYQPDPPAQRSAQRGAPTVRPRTQPSRGARLLGALLAIVLFVGAVALCVIVRRSPSRRAGSRASVSSTTVRVTLPASAPRAKEEPPRASFTYHSTLAGHGGSIYLFGVAKNTGKILISAPEIIVVMRDAQGRELGTRNCYAQCDELQPGESCPTKILLAKPPAFQALTFETVARKGYSAARAEKLRLEPQAKEPERAPYGDRWVFKGKVHNEGSRGARFVKIRAVGLDAQGKILGLDDGYAKAEVLAPGEWARYEVGVSFAAKPARYELTVKGRPVSD